MNINGYENSDEGSKQHENKIDLSNLHIINDTLICEMKQSFLFMSESRDIKLSKNGGNFYVTLPANKKDSIRESCNKFVSTLKLNSVTYVCADNEPEFIKQSNECLADKKFNEVSKEYNKEKSDYLKALLKSNIK